MIISFINEDGGAGKTTLTSSIASILLGKEKKVLLIDLTPKASLTRSFLKDDIPGNGSSLYSTLSSGGDLYIHNVPGNDNLKILTGHDNLKEISSGIDPLILRTKLESVKNDFDYILIDTANNGILVDIAILASDKIIIVTKPSRDSLFGAKKALNLVSTLRSSFNISDDDISIKAIILNQYGDNSVSHKVEEEMANDPSISRYFNNLHVIPDNATVNRMQWNYRNVGVDASFIGASKVLVKIVAEVIE